MRSFYILVCLLLLLSSIKAEAFEQRNWLQNQESPESISQKLLPRDKWIPYPKYSQREEWEKLMGSFRQKYIARGETVLNHQWQVITAGMYMEFEKSGNRKIMENPFSINKQAFANLLYAELAEGKGRFLPAIVDGIFFYCEQTSWVLSAHTKVQKNHRSLPDFEDVVIDLGAIQIAGMLSWAYYFLHEEIDKSYPTISKRLKHNLRKRIVEPYMSHDYWWMALNSTPETTVNNWNPWCNTSVLECMLLIEDDTAELGKEVFRTMQSVDEYLNHCNEDGGCDEGTSYWWHAPGKLIDYLHLLNTATGGKINIYDKPMIKNLGEYISRSYVGNGYFVNFADGDVKVMGDVYMLYRYGKLVESDELKLCARYFFNDQMEVTHDVWRTLNSLAIYDEVKNAPAGTSTAPYTWYPQTQVCYLRQGDFMVATKAGHNNESHNHNDVGTFSLYYKTEPTFIDAGVGTYTRQTFKASERYKIWTMQSDYHNIPQINGYPQHQGGKYKASNVTFDSKNRSFQADIAGAYPSKANVKSWVRSYRIAPNRLEIKDKFQLSALNGKSNLIRFLTHQEPNVARPGIIEVMVEKETIRLKYNASQFDVSVEPIELTDSKLLNRWGHLYRITLTAKSQKLKDEYKFTIETK